DEIELMQQRNGLRHIEWLESLGLLGPDLQLVHCVHVTEPELDLIAARGATIIHCPVSNMYLASGAAPVRAMLARGIPVALGTDGSASHNSQDLLETMKIAALLAKVSSGDATAVLPTDVLRMVTTNGARLLGQPDLGQLKPGAKADLTLVNLNTARSQPVHQPASALVYNATGPDVHTVIVAGQVLLDAGRVTVVDEEALFAECRTAAKKLLARAGVA
nr:amidohydrolase family protein [Anaerolineae bacterium]